MQIIIMLILPWLMPGIKNIPLKCDFLFLYLTNILLYSANYNEGQLRAWGFCSDNFYSRVNKTKQAI